MTRIALGVVVSCSALVLLVGPGCGSDYSDDEQGCTLVSFNSETFCVASQEVVVEEGFQCPEAMPHQHMGDGFVVCSESETPLSEGELVELYEMWQGLPEDGGQSQPDPIPGESDPRPMNTPGQPDQEPEMDPSNPAPDEPGPDMNPSSP
ncbi:MAG: hypothetical protein AAFX99_23865, partial [Myxococcota bacterium]